MSEENVEIVRELLEAFRHRDHDREFQLLAENVVVDPRRFADTPLAVPGWSDVFCGHRGVREFWRMWLDAWEEIEFETPEFVDAGGRVLVAFKQRNKGKGSGIWIDQPLYWGVYSVKDGQVVRLDWFSDRAEALEAAGLKE